MTTKQQTLEEILLACAGTTVPCPNSLGNLASLPNEPAPQERCTGCNVEGRHYVLGDEVRAECPLNWETYALPLLEHPGQCFCAGRSWVLNPDPYTWRRAWRNVGGCIDIDNSPQHLGDWVVVQLILPGERRHQGIIAHVTESEGLRDQLAEATAIYRAINQIPGVRMFHNAVQRALVYAESCTCNTAAPCRAHGLPVPNKTAGDRSWRRHEH